MIYVPGFGPSTAKLAVVGEAPGGDEEKELRPFAGASGRIIRSCFSEVGYEMDQCYTTNVVKVRPPANDIGRLHELGKSISDFTPQLWEEIKALEPNCILAVGDTALQALTGERGISKYRGSILTANDGKTKVVPTLHPAGLLHAESSGMSSWQDLVFIKWDIKRAIKQSTFPDLRRPHRTIKVCKSHLDLYRWLDSYERVHPKYGQKIVSVDIETFKTIPICIGLAFDSENAISIPLFGNLGIEISRMDLREIWRDVARIMADPEILKVGQNFKFDAAQLMWPDDMTLWFGIIVRSFFFDTHLAFRELYCELQADLAFQTSVLTEEPYYKDEGKEYNPKKDKIDKLLSYNAKDAYVTFECFEREMEELESRGLLEHFFTEVMPCHPMYQKMEWRGIRRDAFQVRYLREKYTDLLNETHNELISLTKFWGVEDVNVNSNGMNGQVGRLLYQAMEIPLRAGADENTLDALCRNTIKDANKRRVVELILKERKIRKTIGTYIDCESHPDGRLRTGVNIMLETGRTSTRKLKPPVTTRPLGMAFQTITKHGDVGSDLRSQMVADPGYVLVEADQSGAEARVVAILADDERLQKIFRYGLDIHRITFGQLEALLPPELDEFFECEDHDRLLILKKKISEILKQLIPSDEDRQKGKKFRHAGHYDMGKREAARQVGCSEWRAGRHLDAFHVANPKIRGVFHEGIKTLLRENNRTLVNPFGRTRQFLGKFGQDMFKEAYAQIPQSTVSDQTKRAMRETERREPRIQILEESHDSFLSQAPIISGSRFPFSVLDSALYVIKETLERPIDFSRCSLGKGILEIPSEIKVGLNWEIMEKVDI